MNESELLMRHRYLLKVSSKPGFFDISGMSVGIDPDKPAHAATGVKAA
jgi:hypothetical protein